MQAAEEATVLLVSRQRTQMGRRTSWHRRRRRMQKKDSVIVVMGPSSEPEAGFDPVYGWGAGEHVHEPLIQSTLTVTNKDLTIGYDLATDMETSEDGMTWTVTIRSDVKFTDGGSADSRGCGVYL